jgi:PAS domain-containing protein
LAAVLIAGILALEAHASALIGFVGVGLTFTVVALARSMSDEARLAECRKGLALTSARSMAYIRALECAGVPVFVLDRQGAWLSANVTAMHAVGMPEQVESLGRTNTELDHGAAESLMYSASRASWLAWMESFRAARLDEGDKALDSYEHPITLYDRDGVRTSYLLRALAGEEGETILVGCRTA